MPHLPGPSIFSSKGHLRWFLFQRFFKGKAREICLTRGHRGVAAAGAVRACQGTAARKKPKGALGSSFSPGAQRGGVGQGLRVRTKRDRVEEKGSEG